MRILIMSASTGGGHKRASQAIESYVKQHDPEAVVKIADTLEYIGHLFNKTISEGYVFMAKKVPRIYGSVYNSANRETPLNSMVNKITEQVAKRLLPLITEFKPDVIITVHPFASEMIGKLKKDRLVTVPFICIITDFAPHRTYINPQVDSYVVSSEEMVDAVEAYGIDRKIIHSIGIPIDPVFYEKYDKPELMRQMQLDPEKPTVLIMAGSFGVTDILKIYQNISEIEVDFQIIVITGNNKKLYEEFERLLAKAEEQKKTESLKELHKHRKMHLKRMKNTDELVEDFILKKDSELTRLFKEQKNKLKLQKDKIKFKIKKTKGELKEELLERTLIQKLYKGSGATKPTKLLFFVNDVNKYMSISDLIITKPGGLTVSESLASALPMAIFQAFPGQEEENAEFLVRNNMAIMLPKGRQCKAEVERLLTNPEILAKMKESCRSFCKEQSAKAVYELALELTEKQRDGLFEEKSILK